MCFLFRPKILFLRTLCSAKNTERSFSLAPFVPPKGAQPTLRASAEPSLLELCRAARRKPSVAQVKALRRMKKSKTADLTLPAHACGSFAAQEHVPLRLLRLGKPQAVCPRLRTSLRAKRLLRWAFIVRRFLNAFFIEPDLSGLCRAELSNAEYFSRSIESYGNTFPVCERTGKIRRFQEFFILLRLLIRLTDEDSRKVQSARDGG